MNLRPILAAAVAAWLVSGCSAQRERLPPLPADATVVDRVAYALAAGARAESREGNAAALAMASQTLALTGAHPAEPSEPDLAVRWAERARALGDETPIPYRGRTLGPGYRLSRVAPGRELALDQIFMGGRKAEVAVVPVAPSPFVLEVRQDGERVICRRNAADPSARCSWIPVYTGRHSVAVRNTGQRAADYFIITN